MTKKKTMKKTKAKKKISSAKPSKKKPEQKKEPPHVVPMPTADRKVNVVPMPTAGRKVVEFEDRLDASLLTAEEQQKRGRGRPRKEAEQPPPEIDVKVIGQSIQIPFDLWSVSQDIPDLKISVQESVMIAKPLKQILDHYMPNVPDITWAWIGLSAVSYSILKSRLLIIAEIKKARTSSEEQMDAARGKKAPQGQGGPHPSASFPSFEEITRPA